MLSLLHQAPPRIEAVVPMAKGFMIVGGMGFIAVYERIDDKVCFCHRFSLGQPGRCSQSTSTVPWCTARAVHRVEAHRLGLVAAALRRDVPIRRPGGRRDQEQPPVAHGARQVPSTHRAPLRWVSILSLSTTHRRPARSFSCATLARWGGCITWPTTPLGGPTPWAAATPCPWPPDSSRSVIHHPLHAKPLKGPVRVHPC